MEVFESEYELGDIEARALFAEACFLLEMPEKLSAALEVGDEIKVCLSLEGKLEADEEGRVKRTLEDLAFADGVRNLLLRDDLLFGEDLHGIYAPRVLLAHLENPTERAPADELEEFEITRREGTLGLSTPDCQSEQGQKTRVITRTIVPCIAQRRSGSGFRP